MPDDTTSVAVTKTESLETRVARLEKLIATLAAHLGVEISVDG